MAEEYSPSLVCFCVLFLNYQNLYFKICSSTDLQFLYNCVMHCYASLCFAILLFTRQLVFSISLRIHCLLNVTNVP